ncbi:hypothetical protein KQI49_01560 [Virgibacillus sp. MSJ-26]|uniref:hypothetical protein n=1 Tax=Virgibacillus sp. MSJ-26 TaxID=2841522 RepID=UPI001C11E08E|nr:hypothetical protein [Virgibacillus sp. MSJ-26]MBU5465514.1 hypothetical protein [Virgibacillus sp. MSJ-26]
MVDTQTQLIHYQFETETDLTDKANKFLTYLENLEEQSKQLHLLAENELSSNLGLIIDEAKEKIQQRTEYQQLYYDASKSSMKNMAAKYTDIVNSMNSHQLTIYYDVIKNDES